MKELKSFEENLKEWLEEQKCMEGYMKTRIRLAIAREGIESYEDLKYYIKNNIKIEGLSKHYGMKYVKEFYNECYAKEVKEVEEVKENDNDELILEKIEYVNIKNSYIKLIRNKIDIIDKELNEKDIDDYTIDELKNIYDIMDFYF